MYLQTKKVVIIYIVTIITFASLLNNLYRETQSTIPQISVVTAEELSYKTSFAQSFFNDLSVDGGDNEELALYGASIYQIGQSSAAQLTNIVNGSGTIIIIGDVFNNYLSELIIDNPERQFVLVENSSDYQYDNVYQINIDYNEVYNAINRVSAHEKSVVIISNQYSSLAESMYYENPIATNGNIKLEVVKDSTDVSTLQSNLKKDFKNGFTNVYSLDPYSNSTIIEVVNAYNKDVELKQNNSLKSEVSEVASESSKTVDNSVVKTEDIVENSEYVSLKFLSLSPTEFLSQDENQYLSKYVYDVSKYTKRIIESTMNEKIEHSDELISITNNN